MANTSDVFLGVFSIASTYRLRFAITKDGVAWGGIDSVAVVFEDPADGTQTTRSATAEDVDAGIWFYDVTTTDLPTAGSWRVGVRVTDGTTYDRYPYKIVMLVTDQP